MDCILKPGLHYAGDSKFMEKLAGIDPESYWISVGIHPVQSIAELKPDDFFQLHFRLLGGKGGFGSLLKSFRIHKSSNQLMARDLTGRRLADVQEEERLRRWISRKAERDKKKKEKEEEKLRKLKTGSKVKHEFKDKKYMRQRDVLIEKVDDAFEAGMKAESEKPGPSRIAKPAVAKPVEAEESDSDIDLDAGLPIVNKNKKRKMIVAEKEQLVVEKKAKLGSGSGSSGTSIKLVVAEPEKEEPAEKVKGKKTAAVDVIVEKKDFPLIDLEEHTDAVSLEQLGLDHLKHELEKRDLKCGGSLKERADRLFSIKGLTVDQYPKKIRANKK